MTIKQPLRNLTVKCPYDHCKCQQTIKFNGHRKIVYCANNQCRQLFVVLWDIDGGRVFKLTLDGIYQYD